MTRLYWITLYGALLAAVMITAFSDLLAHEQHVAAVDYALRHGGLFFNAVFGPALIPFCVMLGLFTIHGLILHYCRIVTTRSGRRLGCLLCFALPLAFAGDYRDDNLNDILPLVFLQGAIAWLVVFSRYSIPARWSGLLPLFLCYLFIFFQIVVRSVMSESYSYSYFGSWHLLDTLVSITGFSLLYFAILPMAGYLFPKHRNLKQYFKPAKLPRLSPCHPEGARP